MCVDRLDINGKGFLGVLYRLLKVLPQVWQPVEGK